MYPSNDFIDLEDRIVLVTVASLFRLVVIFFFLKLLIARMTCHLDRNGLKRAQKGVKGEYRRMYRSMMGHARLCRAPKRWESRSCEVRCGRSVRHDLCQSFNVGYSKTLKGILIHL